MNEIPKIQINNELSLPVLGLGTWEMGGSHQADKTQDSHWIDAISNALDMGITHIDTAAMYGNGHTERLVGEAIKAFDREKLFITTKVAGNKLQFSEVIRSAESSLRRLNIDQIDLLLLHWPNPSVPISQTISAINMLAEEGRIKWFGLSNFPVNLMREIEYYTDLPILTNQLEYNLFTRNNGRYNENVESVIIPYCLSKGISITAWRPVLKGSSQELQHPVIKDLCDKYDKTAFQIALNWLANKPFTLSIPKMSSKEHLAENIAAVQFKMEEEDYQLLDMLGR